MCSFGGILPRCRYTLSKILFAPWGLVTFLYLVSYSPVYGSTSKPNSYNFQNTHISLLWPDAKREGHDPQYTNPMVPMTFCVIHSISKYFIPTHPNDNHLKEPSWQTLSMKNHFYKFLVSKRNYNFQIRSKRKKKIF